MGIFAFYDLLCFIIDFPPMSLSPGVYSRFLPWFLHASAG
jgi:hypothetical protein